MKRLLLLGMVMALMAAPVTVMAGDMSASMDQVQTESIVTPYDGQEDHAEDLDTAAVVTSASCDITYELDGGTNSTKNPEHITKTLSLKNPTKAGFTFAGWYKDAEFTTRIKKVYPSWESVTLYAKWNENHYKITYSTGLKTLKFSSQTVAYTDTVSLNDIPDGTRAGYTFARWKAGSGKSVRYYNGGAEVSGLSSKNKAAIKLVAVWTPITYSITCVTNGTNNNPSTYNITQKVKLKDSYYLDNYKFCGWYLTSDFTGSRVKAIKKGTTGDITLYAKFIKTGTGSNNNFHNLDAKLVQQYILEEINEYREAAGLSKLQIAEYVQKAADIRAREVVITRGHCRSLKSYTTDCTLALYDQIGIKRGAGEVVSSYVVYGFGTVDDSYSCHKNEKAMAHYIVEGYRTHTDSNGKLTHWPTLMGKNFNYCGIGYYDEEQVITDAIMLTDNDPQPIEGWIVPEGRTIITGPQYSETGEILLLHYTYGEVPYSEIGL